MTGKNWGDLFVICYFIFVIGMTGYALMQKNSTTENLVFVGFWPRVFATIADAIVINIIAFVPVIAFIFLLAKASQCLTEN